MDKLYMVSVSTGVPSAVAADICLRKFGHKNVELVFCDTQIEDGDNYRFMHECVKYWGKGITTLKDGRTPLQVAEDEHIIPNQWLATCTKVLKTNLFREYALSKKAQGYDVVVVLGMDMKDKRKVITRGKYKGKTRPVPPVVEYGALGLKVYYPLITKAARFLDPLQEIKRWGIAAPRMYAMGYSHANCSGVCVKQGASDWIHTLINFPDRFAKYEAWERTMRLNPTNAKYSFLRDNTSSDTKNKTLERLRLEYQARPNLDMFTMLADLAGENVCSVECGVGFNGEGL